VLQYVEEVVSSAGALHQHLWQVRNLCSGIMIMHWWWTSWSNKPHVAVHRSAYAEISVRNNRPYGSLSGLDTAR
jgi:hypothetical protein